jgi:hypothetical protein
MSARRPFDTAERRRGATARGAAAQRRAAGRALFILHGVAEALAIGIDTCVRRANRAGGMKIG